MIRAAKQGAFEGSDIALDVGRIAGCSAKDPAESGEAGVRGSIPRRSTMSSQQEADCALAIWQSHRGDDQERMDSILKEFFAQVRADEYETQLSAVREEMGKCVIFISDLPSHLSGAL